MTAASGVRFAAQFHSRAESPPSFPARSVGSLDVTSSTDMCSSLMSTGAGGGGGAAASALTGSRPSIGAALAALPLAPMGYTVREPTPGMRDRGIPTPRVSKSYRATQHDGRASKFPTIRLQLYAVARTLRRITYGLQSLVHMFTTSSQTSHWGAHRHIGSRANSSSRQAHTASHAASHSTLYSHSSHSLTLSLTSHLVVVERRVGKEGKKVGREG